MIIFVFFNHSNENFYDAQMTHSRRVILDSKHKRSFVQNTVELFKEEQDQSLCSIYDEHQ